MAEMPGRYCLPVEKDRAPEFYLDKLLENANYIIDNIVNPSANPKHRQYLQHLITQKSNKKFCFEYYQKWNAKMFELPEHQGSPNEVLLDLPLLIPDSPEGCENDKVEQPVLFKTHYEQYIHSRVQIAQTLFFRTVKGAEGQRDFKQRVNHFRHEFYYEYGATYHDEKGHDLDIKTYNLSMLEKQELAKRFRLLRWARWHRILKSMKKFVNQCANMLEFIYEESELDNLLQHVQWALDKSPYKNASIRHLREVQIVDGFINEGKSSDLAAGRFSENTFDSEFSSFWRAKLKKSKPEDADEFLHDKYYPIWILVGIISAIEYHYSKPTSSRLVLDRGWGSIELFCQGEHVIGQKNRIQRAMNPFDYDFYIKLFGLMACLPLNGWANKSKIYLNIYLYSRLGFDTQLDDSKRALEIDLYGRNTETSLLYNQLAYKFLFCLDTIYNACQSLDFQHHYKQITEEDKQNKKAKFAATYLH
jgi:hypothetical protein